MRARPNYHKSVESSLDAFLIKITTDLLSPTAALALERVRVKSFGWRSRKTRLFVLGTDARARNFQLPEFEPALP
jgi:hypothetical protein